MHNSFESDVSKGICANTHLHAAFQTGLGALLQAREGEGPHGAGQEKSLDEEGAAEALKFTKNQRPR